MLWSATAAVLLLLAGGIAAAFAGCQGATFMYDLEQTRPALSYVSPVLETPGPRLSRRVVLAIVDGLRLDVSRELPYLDSLRARGVDTQAVSQYPTFSRPNYVNLLTGVPPAASGVRTNEHPTTVVLDTLMSRMRAAGLRSGYASDYDSMPRLFLRPPGDLPPEALEAIDVDALLETEEPEPEAIAAAIMADLRSEFDNVRYAPWPGGFRNSADLLVSEGEEDLLVMLIGVVDAAGHAYGGDSEEYREAAIRADQTLGDVLAGIDLSKDTIVVVADHGHTDAGGHGGLEPNALTVPLILAGAGVVPGAQPREPALLQDVAPTVARLLGVPPPGHGLGRTLVELLAVDDASATLFSRQDDLRRARNTAVVAKSLYEAQRKKLEQRAVRLALCAVGALALLGLAWWLRWVGGLRLDWRALVVGVPAFFLVYYMLIAVIGQRFSPSLVPAKGHIATEMLKFGAVATVVQIAAGWWALRRKVTLHDRLAAANGIALVGFVIALTPVALLWALFPAPYTEVPGPRAMVLIPAVQVSVACYAVGIGLTLLLEIVVFFARAVDPRVRVLRLERALEKTRPLAEEAASDVDRPERRRERRMRAARRSMSSSSD